MENWCVALTISSHHQKIIYNYKTVDKLGYQAFVICLCQGQKNSQKPLHMVAKFQTSSQTLCKQQRLIILSFFCSTVFTPTGSLPSAQTHAIILSILRKQNINNKNKPLLVPLLHSVTLLTTSPVPHIHPDFSTLPYSKIP